jgi:excisionase family DNA binding protein
MTVERAARELSVSRMTIYELMKCGALKSVKIGASRRIVSASVERVVNHGATRKPETA